VHLVGFIVRKFVTSPVVELNLKTPSSVHLLLCPSVSEITFS